MTVFLNRSWSSQKAHNEARLSLSCIAMSLRSEKANAVQLQWLTQGEWRLEFLRWNAKRGIPDLGSMVSNKALCLWEERTEIADVQYPHRVFRDGQRVLPFDLGWHD